MVSAYASAIIQVRF